MTRLLNTCETFVVDPARLTMGRWCHRAERTIGEGDIPRLLDATANALLTFLDSQIPQLMAKIDPKNHLPRHHLEW